MPNNHTHQKERGQALVEFALVLPVLATLLLGRAAFVVDVGAWFLDRRQLQSAVDAAALAAGQDLPDAASAGQDARDYATRNGLASPSITFSSQDFANDTIDVGATRTSQS